MRNDDHERDGNQELRRPGFTELVSRKTLMARLDIKSPTTIYAMVARGDLSRPITWGGYSQRWVWAPIEEKIARAHDQANAEEQADGSPEASS